MVICIRIKEYAELWFEIQCLNHVNVARLCGIVIRQHLISAVDMCQSHDDVTSNAWFIVLCERSVHYP